MKTMHETHTDASDAAVTHLNYTMPGDKLKLLVMDDSSFDRRAISRLTRKSRFNLEMVEAESIADARAMMVQEKPDLMFLDYRVPDGDGIEFSTQIVSEFQQNAPPIVIITGEGDERTAIRSLRSGVADYLAKDSLSSDAFDASIQRCLSARPINKSDLMNEVDRVNHKLSAFCETTNRNMQLARAFMMPMAEYAWRSVNSLEGDRRGIEARKLMKITQRLTGFLDETLIDSVTAEGDGARRLLDLGEMLSDLTSNTPEIADFVDIADPEDFPTIAGNRTQVEMLLRELLSEALTSVPANRKPHVRVHCGADPRNNPILCITDNGASLEDRKQSFAGMVQSVGDNGTALPGRTTRMSICQKLAELNGGQLRLADADGVGSVVMIRFPRSSAKLH